jgi:cyclopropane-fatty-acyl-phospholipid synthase
MVTSMVTDKRAALLRQFLEHLRSRLNLEIGFVLWDGSTVPADLPGDALAISTPG